MAFWSKNKLKNESPQPDDSEPPIAAPVLPSKVHATNGAAPHATAQSAGLSPEDLEQRLKASNRFWKTAGECVGVLMQSEQHKHMTLAELERVLLPPLTLGQFMVAENRSGADGIQRPVAIALWACVSPEVDRRLASSTDGRIALASAEWNSGDIVWLTAIAGEDRYMAMILKRLQDTALKGRAIKMRARDKSGTVSVKQLAAKGE